MNEFPNTGKFALLTPQERAAADATLRDKKDDGECVMPVPADAPLPPKTHLKLGVPTRIWTYTGEGGETLFYICRFETPDGKEIRPQSLWRASCGRLEWRWKSVPEPRPLYGLDRLAARPDAPVIVCEGEKASDAAAKVFQNSACVASPGGSKAASKADWKPLAGRKVLIWPDEDESGSKYSAEVAAILRGLRCEVSIINAMTLASVAPDGGQREPVKGWDAADAIADWQDLSALRKAAMGLAKPFKAATDAANDRPPPCYDIDAEIARLAKLRIVEYERAREAEAKRLGLRKPVLDKLVANERPCDTAPGQGRPLELPEPEPWPEHIDGAALLSEIADAIRKYVVLSQEDADTVAIWCVHTFVFEAFPCTPRLAITSPEKRCGKTTLLDVIEALAARPLQTSNISAAAVFRTVEIARPTLLIDEADTFLGDKDELRGILNSGHRHGGQVIRTVGDDFEPRAFSTHSPCAIAMIGKLPDTLADRSVVVSLKRRLPSEPISPFRSDRVDALKVLARKAARWTADNAVRLGDADPDLPSGIINREADNWRPLFSIAAVVGGDWPERTHLAALALTGAPEDSLKAELLADIRDAFAGKDRISSDELVAYLISLEERPWSESNHGKPMTKNQLARRLKPFGLKPKTIRIEDATPKGYTLHDFDKTCARYLPPRIQTATSGTTNDFNGVRENQTATRDFPVAAAKSINRGDINDVADVAVQKGGNGQREHVAGPGEAENKEAENKKAPAFSLAERPNHVCHVCGTPGFFGSDFNPGRWFCYEHKGRRDMA